MHPRRLPAAALLLIVVASVAQWVILFLRLPFFKTLSGWFWKGHYTAPDAPVALLIPALGAVGVLVHFQRHPHRTRLNLLLFVLLGYVLQVGFACVENRGLEALRDRLNSGGHSVFARIAAERPSPWRVATRYEKLLESGELDSGFVKTKPPGTLLFYILAERCSAAFFPHDATPDERRVNLATFASYTFPLLASLAILPLYWISKMLLGREDALLAPLLFVLAPNVILITLSLDQAIFPTIFLVSVGLTLCAILQDNLWIGFHSGIVAFLAAAFISFSLIPALTLSLLFALSWLIPRGPERGSVLRVGRFLMVFFAGIGVTAIAFMLLGYDFVSRFHNSMAVHLTARYYNPSLRTTLLYALLNYFEFAWWIGVPITMLALAGIMIGLRRLVTSHPEMVDRFCAALVATVLLLGLFGRTKGESARLWLPLVPLACLMAARACPWFRSSRGFLYLIATLQLLSILFIKLYQDV